MYNLHLHFGHLADAFNQSDLHLVHLSEEKETTIYIAVGTVKMFIETSAKHLELQGIKTISFLPTASIISGNA